MTNSRGFLNGFSMVLLAACVAAVGTGPARADASRAEILSIIHSTPSGKAPDLKMISANNMNLAGIDFRGANLHGTQFQHSDLKQARLAGSNLDLTNLMHADFSGADLHGTSLYGTVAIDADFRGANLSDAKLLGNFHDADFIKADLRKARAGANMSNQSMGLIRFVGVNAKFDGAQMADADLAVCDVRFASFRDADLRGASFKSCDLRQADFSGANMAGADLTGARLDGATFTGIKGRDSIKGAAHLPNGK
jgi:uncharacterized protein YjbI with pentapeptide repeats